MFLFFAIALNFLHDFAHMVFPLLRVLDVALLWLCPFLCDRPAVSEVEYCLALRIAGWLDADNPLFEVDLVKFRDVQGFANHLL